MLSRLVRSKDQVRKAVWKAMDREGVSRFPGAEGRIPNFAGAKRAAERLAGHRVWKRAQVVKANPDSPQTHARRLALEQGKIVVMAVPRLGDLHPFRVLDPRKLSKAAIREAATIKGALRHGRVVALEEIPEIDFVLCGSVAVNLNGARLGKGGGFSDLEYGILIDTGKIDEHSVIATTVHPIQILRENLQLTAHDLPVDLIATPRAVIEVENPYERPRGILWDHLQPPQIREIPVLERMGYA
jgi:5-formyltetrahydrofolate cyclo-ligase